MTKQKTIKVDLLPQDFKDSDYGSVTDCPLARAVRRHFNISFQDVLVTPYDVDIFKKSKVVTFDIKSGFWRTTYQNVKAAYEKDPKAEKVIYYVELIPVK